MRQDERSCLEAALADVPLGTLQMERHGAQEGSSASLSHHFHASTEGKGRLEVYHVCPGVTSVFASYLADRAAFRHDALETVLEIDHCRTGRIGWNMRDGRAVYLGAGDLCLHSMACCCGSVMTFPTGYSTALSFTVDLARLGEDLPPALRAAGLDPRSLVERFCKAPPLAFPAGAALDCVFSPLYGLPEELRAPYLQLKAQELLLCLSRLQPGGREAAQYFSQQIERVREIHDLLTGHLDRRYTIEALSKRYLINTSSLKEVFKAVYGLPIATYMKEYRVHRAMELLRETDMIIADIAAQVGYESQGKFTNAFKDVAHMLPTEYRKQCRVSGAGPG